MANTYFTDFPEININGRTQIDLSPRVVHPGAVFTSNMLETYRMEEGETPQSLAQDFYGDPELDWLIYLANQTVDPLLDFPLDYIELRRLCDKKYNDPFETHHWIKDGVILRECTPSDGGGGIGLFNLSDGTTEGQTTPNVLSQATNVTITPSGGVIFTLASPTGVYFSDFIDEVAITLDSPTSNWILTINWFDSFIEGLLFDQTPTSFTNANDDGGGAFSPNGSGDSTFTFDQSITSLTVSADLIDAGFVLTTIEMDDSVEAPVDCGEAVSNYQYEEELNNQKKIIKVLRPEFAQIAVARFEELKNG